MSKLELIAERILLTLANMPTDSTREEEKTRIVEILDEQFHFTVKSELRQTEEKKA